VKYEVFITYADYEAAQRANQPLFARKLPLTMAILTAVALGYMRLTGRPIDSCTLMGVGGVWCAVFYLNRVSLPKGWRREFEQSERQRYAVELNEEGFRLVSQFENVSWPWRFFSGWRDTDKCFLLYYNKGWNNIIIPKSAIDTDEETVEVRRLLARFMGRPRG
jgi:hypothetical protein